MQLYTISYHRGVDKDVVVGGRDREGGAGLKAVFYLEIWFWWKLERPGGGRERLSTKNCTWMLSLAIEDPVI